jgi:hypothetical protein
LLGAAEGSLPGKNIKSYVPELASIPSVETARIYRTEMQTRGQKESGEMFLTDIFFSTYRAHGLPLY